MTVKQAQDTLLLSVVHDAFRRDADHLARAVESQAATDPARRASVLAGWDVFHRQLRSHQDGQDENLWPALRQYLVARPEESDLIDAMESEHRRIAPLATAVDTALHNGDLEWLVEAATPFREELLAHLRHEENDVGPLLLSVFAAQDWRALAAAHRKSTSSSNAAEFLPYVLAEADPETVTLVTARLSGSARWAFVHRHQPRFARVIRW